MHSINKPSLKKAIKFCTVTRREIFSEQYLKYFLPSILANIFLSLTALRSLRILTNLKNLRNLNIFAFYDTELSFDIESKRLS
jgi:hypothetical protein